MHTTPLAAFASQVRGNGTRLFDEAGCTRRTGFQRDRDRIIHSTAFRRLAHKTQVFTNPQNDHHRTRLTHTIEVAQIARSLASILRMNSDLAETIALAHDFGHTPFGHVGEDALKDRMEGFGGFEHNIQSLRVVARLERRYPAFDGLNLTIDTLEGIAKHNGPCTDRRAVYDAFAGMAGGKAFAERLQLDLYAPLEAQIAAISDDIAYNAHDIDDGLRDGLFSLAGLDGLALPRRLHEAAKKSRADLEERHAAFLLVRDLIDAMIEDVVAHTHGQIEKLAPGSLDDIRRAGRAMVAFSPQMKAQVDEIRRFLFKNMYGHNSLRPARARAQKIVGELFDYFLAHPGEIRHMEGDATACRMTPRAVCDYVAGMTDTFAERVWDERCKNRQSRHAMPAERAL